MFNKEDILFRGIVNVENPQQEKRYVSLANKIGLCLSKQYDRLRITGTDTPFLLIYDKGGRREYLSFKYREQMFSYARDNNLQGCEYYYYRKYKYFEAHE